MVEPGKCGGSGEEPGKRADIFVDSGCTDQDKFDDVMHDD
jgi:hypothetical protein